MKKYYFDKNIVFIIFIFIFISIISIYRAEKLLLEINYYYIKQIIWYIIGFLFIFFIMKISNERIYKHTWILYILSNISLIFLLLFARPINEAKCWFTIKGIGTIQPSEFTKIVLIILIANLICEYKKKYIKTTVKEEFLFLLKIICILIPPCILTFMQPDTGVVLIYLIITIIMLFASGIRYRWFFLLALICFTIIGSILLIYFFNENLFIDLFGNRFFLRVNRLLDWSNKSGYQLENSLISIGSAGLMGHGFNLDIYFPEPQTDFIFAVYSSCFGLIGSLILLFLTAYFDIHLILLAKNEKNLVDKYVIIGIVGMLLYQQFQNIGMTFGIMPITGITLPFISYGGSSLLSYMIMLGLIFNIYDKNHKYTNK